MTSTDSREAREGPGKTRRRSRFGCRNCKLRKLKCDESKPQCKRCSSFGVVCTFTSTTTPDLHPIPADSRRSWMVRGTASAASLQAPLSNAIWTSDASTFFRLNTRCQDFITRYLGRSLITPDDPNMGRVNRKLLEQAFTHPYLMHASLAVSLTYDRHLNSPLDSHRTLEECYHWSQSTILFNKKLRESIEPDDRDPIWGTAAALVILTFSSPNARTPEESWPLNPSPSSYLDWVHMNKGKMSLWNIVNPLRSDSIFHVMAGTFAYVHSPLPQGGVEGIPPALAALCGITDDSTAETIPYFHAAHAVAQILEVEDSEVTMGPVQMFMRCIQGGFEGLLRDRDPVALVLLYLWYRKAGRCIWWIGLRARVECPAIWMYLRRYHGGDEAVMGLLPEGGKTSYRLDLY
ncbi:hypothetical protein BO79DRAFT_261691 [Aspergillus costaricaensis CBS 115574]|uniref:Uncharacterized protein n=1 Tax=Aspergillus costaricaensis CBS 115574 TaxID=1448317 RepID=A0ACD1IVX0_9EURO|nr:hypothetical protein BO79DRAFT_261691 [Aspergillus costaricaensis CBS 115574]RAK94518.1 hypothetical protein BO79DRAFT_261691 [Aspergillus costaricaensis CBS 115574]